MKFSNRPRVSKGLSFRSYAVGEKSPWDLSLRLEMADVLSNRGQLRNLPLKNKNESAIIFSL